MQKYYVKIDGIHCSHCETKIITELLKNNKIKDVEIKRNIAHITYKGALKKKEIVDSIKKIDYITKEEYISNNLQEIDTKIKGKEFIIILLCILTIFLTVKKIFGFNILNVIPTIDNSITYGMLVITGLLTSIHCISMCGAINLVATINSNTKRNFKKPLLYNIGRILSYTIIGGLAGLIGSILSINDITTGIIIIFASIIMLSIALNMLGIIKFKLPNLIQLKRINKLNNKAFFIGILNGFMPCGPLQAMQLYALSTGSFIRGAISMFLFGIGTLPLMLLIGIMINIVKGKKRIIINKIASVLILLLSIVMLNRGLLFLNIDILKSFHKDNNFIASTIYKNNQVIEFNLSYNNYEDIIIQKDIPVTIIIHVDEKYLTGCNNKIIMKDFGIEQTLEVGDNIIEFTPTKIGTFTYTCWMNMIKNNIKVIDDESYFKPNN